MDSERFDGLTRDMATRGTSRRQMLRGVGGTLAGAMLAGFGLRSAVAAPKSGVPKKPHTNNGAHGERANQGNNGPGGPLGNPGPNGGECDNCSWMCSNCPIACCGA